MGDESFFDEKCWYVLRQRHYAPPKPPPPKSKGVPWQGQICLGHIIPGPRQLDQVKNRSDLVAFGADTPVYPSKTWNLTANFSAERHLEASAEAAAPIGGLPVDVSLDAGAVFRKIVSDHAQFERLDTFVIAPSESYIKKTLETASVKKYVQQLRNKHLGLNTWTLYMISGIAIARGASGSRQETSQSGGHMKVAAGAPGIAGGAVNTGAGQKKEINMSFQKATDFVWSLRLTEISKSLLSSEPTDKTYIKAATYSLEDTNDTKVALAAALQSQGLKSQDLQVLQAADDGLVFVDQCGTEQGGSEPDDKEPEGDEPAYRSVS